MLCDNCQQSALRDDSPAFRVETNIFGHRSVVTDEESTIPTNYFLLDHLPELPQLRESALNGCELCSFLRESILFRDTAKFLQDDEGIEITSLEEEITLQIRYPWNHTVDDTNERRHYLQVIVKFMETNLEFFISCVIGAAEKGDPVAKWLRLDDPSTKALNRPKTIRWIKERIRDCKEHDHKLPTSGFVPKLLLDVRGEVPKLTDQDTLISTQKTRGQLKTRTPRYTALSYCWGTAEDAKVQVTTTTSSFSERQAGIETKDITPVLQDAIIITKQLSIPYLWIDSLCIFQDDIADWNRQCMDMDKIYGHAEVTILAASSTSCREGFIKRKVPQIRLPYHSALNQALQGSMWIELQEVGSSSAPLLSNIFDDTSNSRLATRGWAFQESHTVASYFWAATTTAYIMQEQSETFKNSVEFAKRLKNDYFAGHWGNDLIMGLMWTVNGPAKVSKSVHLGRVCSPIQYLVPSWSRLFELNGSNAFGAIKSDYYVSITEIHEEVKLWKLILLGTCKESQPGEASRQMVEHEEDMYPFGLIVHGIKHSEWCRIGIFTPAEGGPYLSLQTLSLQTFKMASTLGNITVI
ncbi:hypothetical protein G7054_g14424 [Neopestalotiopsis clavispora]|nr:hypothetical protein G7054_g14424 [Neopestalotiopsis clavispora]